MLYIHPVLNNYSEAIRFGKSLEELTVKFVGICTFLKIMYFWYLTICEPIVHISPIATLQGLRRASTDPPHDW